MISAKLSNNEQLPKWCSEQQLIDSYTWIWLCVDVCSQCKLHFILMVVMVALLLTVQPLVVSVGDNKVLQLPEDSVTLSAYTISQDKGVCNWLLDASHSLWSCHPWLALALSALFSYTQTSSFVYQQYSPLCTGQYSTSTNVWGICSKNSSFGGKKNAS